MPAPVLAELGLGTELAALPVASARRIGGGSTATDGCPLLPTCGWAGNEDADWGWGWDGDWNRAGGWGWDGDWNRAGGWGWDGG